MGISPPSLLDFAGARLLSSQDGELESSLALSAAIGLAKTHVP